jgi:hypothetical protein
MLSLEERRIAAMKKPRADSCVAGAVDTLPLEPDGQITDNPVQPLLQKYFSSRFDQISFLLSAIPSHTEGRCATSRTRGGMRWTLTVHLTKAPDADGEGVWS